MGSAKGIWGLHMQNHPEFLVAKQVHAEHGSAAWWRVLKDSQHWFRNLGGFHAKLGLCSRKEGEILQKSIKPWASWSPWTPWQQYWRKRTVRRFRKLFSTSQCPDSRTLTRIGTVRLLNGGHEVMVSDWWLMVGLWVQLPLCYWEN